MGATRTAQKKTQNGAPATRLAGGIAFEPQRAWGRAEVEALLRVSDAAALATDLSAVLDVIATEACNVTRAKAASILLAETGGAFRLAASRGLSSEYDSFLRSSFISHGHSTSRAAATELKPIVIDDMMRDPRVDDPDARDWKRFAEREGYTALISVPLLAGSRNSGVLNLYRVQPGRWLEAEVELAAMFAQHAASAIDSARLIDSQRRQLEALEHLIRVLRDQTHEYANRLHALSGLLALGETREAQRFLAQLMTVHHDNYASVIERVHEPILAGLLVAQMSVARQRGVDVRLHRQTRLEALPEALGSAEAVTIVANLIENAVEAVSGEAAHRRKALVRISQNRGSVTISVRDWGPGIEKPLELVSERGVSTKEGHPGIGLALVSEAVHSAHGSLTARRLSKGTAFTVVLPLS